MIRRTSLTRGANLVVSDEPVIDAQLELGPDNIRANGIVRSALRSGRSRPLLAVDGDRIAELPCLKY